jgi:MinD-like ATPase involved in chromosome partitioning or flagellar assembly
VRPGQQSLQRAVETWGKPPAAVLPWSPEECTQAVAKRRPVVLDQPQSSLAMIIQALAQRIVEATGVKTKARLPV